MRRIIRDIALVTDSLAQYDPRSNEVELLSRAYANLVRLVSRDLNREASRAQVRAHSLRPCSRLTIGRYMQNAREHAHAGAENDGQDERDDARAAPLRPEVRGGAR
ncbi:MAG TPA: hypothetical protein VKV24_14600 [Casimicrobiaceae bacterium]|nr:hypothetical protein [Casimicrobiaceae bacterium]